MTLEEIRADVAAVAFAFDVVGNGELGGHAEVADLEGAAEGDEDVGGLEVEMDVIFVVDVLDALEELSVFIKRVGG